MSTGRPSGGQGGVPPCAVERWSTGLSRWAGKVQPPGCALPVHGRPQLSTAERVQGAEVEAVEDS